MRGLARDAGLRSVACCGLSPVPDRPARVERVVEDGVELVVGTARGRLGGVVRCSSPWACPVCGPRIAARRVAEVAPQLDHLTENGWTCWLVTLTLRHTAEDRLGDLFADLGRAWRLTTSGRVWAAIKARGVEYVRGVDLTHWHHGWHPHLHVTLLLGPDHEDPQAVARGLADRWRQHLRGIGRDALDAGQDVQEAADPVAAAAYAMALAGVSKHTAEPPPKGGTARTVAEAVSAASKRGRAGGGRTAADLRDAALAGDETARRLWTIYATATKGKRAVVVSQGLCLTPEAEAAQDPPDEGAVEVVAILGKPGLRRIDAHLPELLCAVVEGVHEARMTLRRYLGNPGDLWDLPPPTPPPRPPPVDPETVPF